MHKFLAVLMILFFSSCTSSTYTPTQPITGYKKKAYKNPYLAKKKMNNCWKGKVDTSTIMTPDDFFSRLQKIKFQKGEYETTQAYKKRLDRELSVHGLSLERPLYVKKKFDPKYIKYNPDSGTLSFIKYGASNHSVKCEAINRIGDYKSYEEYDAQDLCNSFGNKEMNLSFSETRKGAYEASNAFGVMVNVSRIEHIVQGLLEGPEKPRGYYGEPIKLWPKETMFQMRNVSVPQAKELKNKSSVIIGFQLKEPFYKTGEHSYTPSIDVPVDRKYIYKYAIVDIQCAVLMNGKWNVLSRIPLN